MNLYAETGSSESSSYSPNSLSSSSQEASPRTTSLAKAATKGPRGCKLPLSYKEAASRAQKHSKAGNNNNTGDNTSYMNIVLAQIGV